MPYTLLNNEEDLSWLNASGIFTAEALTALLKDQALLEEMGMTYMPVTLVPGDIEHFKDITSEHWAYKAVVEAIKAGIVQGVSQTKFAPDASLQVNDAFTLLDRTLLLNHQVKTKLSREIVSGYWEESPQWAYAHKMSIGSKLQEETLKEVSQLGGKPISRQLLAEILYEVTDGKLERQREAKDFADNGETAYKEALAYCYETGLLEGVTSEQMAPQKILTRAEMMVILTRLSQLLKD